MTMIQPAFLQTTKHQGHSVQNWDWFSKALPAYHPSSHTIIDSVELS